MTNPNIGKIYKHYNTNNCLYMLISDLGGSYYRFYILNHTAPNFISTTYNVLIEDGNFEKQGYIELA